LTAPPAGEVERFPVVAAEADIGGRRITVDDAAELFALWIKDVNAPRRRRCIRCLRYRLSCHPGRRAFLAAQAIEEYLDINEW
jgi:hypothetical protein